MVCYHILSAVSDLKRGKTTLACSTFNPWSMLTERCSRPCSIGSDQGSLTGDAPNRAASQAAAWPTKQSLLRTACRPDCLSSAGRNFHSPCFSLHLHFPCAISHLHRSSSFRCISNCIDVFLHLRTRILSSLILYRARTLSGLLPLTLVVTFWKERYRTRRPWDFFISVSWL